MFSSASTGRLIFESLSLICSAFHRSSRKSCACVGQKHVISVNTVPAEDADTAALALLCGSLGLRGVSWPPDTPKSGNREIWPGVNINGPSFLGSDATHACTDKHTHTHVINLFETPATGHLQLTRHNLVLSFFDSLRDRLLGLKSAET